jgi:16S rRNA (guanine966-N2)-methyltransferase
MGNIRIVGGSLGGRRVKAPDGDATRPTSDRVREAIASVLAARDRIADARVLDLYAGSGALGFEMLSRGAAHALFVERDPKVARLIRDNAGELQLGAQSEILCEDVTRTRAEEAIAQRGPFSLVLADPPYRDIQRAVDAIGRLAGRGALASDACLLLEHGSKGAPVLPSEFATLSSYRYGDTTVVLCVVSCRPTPPAAGAAS